MLVKTRQVPLDGIVLLSVRRARKRLAKNIRAFLADPSYDSFIKIRDDHMNSVSEDEDRPCGPTDLQFKWLRAAPHIDKKDPSIDWGMISSIHNQCGNCPLYDYDRYNTNIGDACDVLSLMLSDDELTDVWNTYQGVLVIKLLQFLEVLESIGVSDVEQVSESG